MTELRIVGVSLFLCEVGSILYYIIPCLHAVDGIVTRSNAGECQRNLVLKHGIVCIGILLCVSLQVLGCGELAHHVLHAVFRSEHQLLHLGVQSQEGVNIFLAVVAGFGTHVHAVGKFLDEHAILGRGNLSVLDNQLVKCLCIGVGFTGNNDAVQLPQHVATDTLVAQ